jgi:hypothetical protein
VAGLNLEHIFNGDKHDSDDSGKIFFEPRHAPMWAASSRLRVILRSPGGLGRGHR